MGQAVLNVTPPIAIADMGYTAYCDQPSISMCGRYKIDDDRSIPTGKKSTKNISMALGNITPA